MSKVRHLQTESGLPLFYEPEVERSLGIPKAPPALGEATRKEIENLSRLTPELVRRIRLRNFIRS